MTTDTRPFKSQDRSHTLATTLVDDTGWFDFTYRVKIVGPDAVARYKGIVSECRDSARAREAIVERYQPSFQLSKIEITELRNF